MRSGVPGADFVAFGPPFPRYGSFRADSCSYHQPSSHQEQVAEREQREELGAVLGQPTIAGLHVTELALDHAERVVNLASGGLLPDGAGSYAYV